MFLHYYGLHGEADEHGVTLRYAGRYGSISKIYGALFVENVVQALARCIVAWQMLQAKRAGFHVVTMTHDEIVALVREDETDARMQQLLGIMRTVPEWAKGVPVDAEGGYDICYSK
jgi:DNA polymerase